MSEPAMKRSGRHGQCEWRHLRRAAGRFLCAAALVLSAASASCVSLKVRPLEDPHARIETLVVCREVREDGESLVPEGISGTFQADSQIVCFLKIIDIPGPVSLRWTWYGPEGELVRDTGEIAVNSEGRYLGSISAYDRLDPEDIGGRTGRWTAAVFIDGVLAGTARFEIK